MDEQVSEILSEEAVELLRQIAGDVALLREAFEDLRPLIDRYRRGPAGAVLSLLKSGGNFGPR